jgi:hypothetical protein
MSPLSAAVPKKLKKSFASLSSLEPFTKKQKMSNNTFTVATTTVSQSSAVVTTANHSIEAPPTASTPMIDKIAADVTTMENVEELY